MILQKLGQKKLLTILFLMNLDGLPATISHGLTFATTTDLAPTIAPSPTLHPGPIKDSAHIQEKLFIDIDFLIKGKILS